MIQATKREVQCAAALIGKYLASENEAKLAHRLYSLQQEFNPDVENWEDAVVDASRQAFQEVASDQRLALAHRLFSLVGTLWVRNLGSLSDIPTMRKPHAKYASLLKRLVLILQGNRRIAHGNPARVTAIAREIAQQLGL